MSALTGDILIVANPVSGRGRRRGEHPAYVAARILRDQGARVDVRHTPDVGGRQDRPALTGGAEEAVRRWVLEYEGHIGCVAACGGDGTVQQVAAALVGLHDELGDATPMMALLPAGRCNDLARALGLNLPPVETARLIIRGCARSFDVGRINGRVYCTVATLGFDAAVSRYVDGMRLPLSGTSAYLYGALRVLMNFEAPQVTLEGDFGQRSGRMYMVSTANTATYGGAIRIAPGATPTDGMLDVCIVDDAPRARLVATLLAVVRGRHVGRPGVHLLRTQTLRITSDRPLELWADGEHRGATPAEIRVQPAALRIIMPG